MRSAVLVLCLTTLFAVQPSHQLNKFVNINSWNNIEFNFPSAASRQHMIEHGFFVPNSSVPIDFGVYKGVTYVTTPRFKEGVPATLSTISKHGNVLSPVLEPYPTWEWNDPRKCGPLMSVFRIKIDECGRLWALDTGSVNIFNGIYHKCSKQIVIFDLNDNDAIRRHVFPEDIIKADTILTTIEVDVRDRSLKCKSTFAYIADTTTYGLLVYDGRSDKSWRITANSFFPNPYYGHFDLYGSSFDLMDGILGLALSPYIANQDRTLYYHSLASHTENYVLTSFLQNETHYTYGGNKVMREFHTFDNVRRGQSAGMAMSSTGVLFYSELRVPNVQCWKSSTPYLGSGDYVVDADNDQLQFVTSIKAIINDVGVEEIWVLSTRLQKYIDGTMNTLTETNFRLMKAPLATLIGTGPCL